jgi:hypothetical protein
MDSKYRGYKGELCRTAGDAAKQRAIEFARLIPGSEVVQAPDCSLRGVQHAFLVFRDLDSVPLSRIDQIVFSN